jgi:hypothetical protein
MPYKHHQTGEDNADAHLKRTLMGHQVMLPITGGKLDLGPWEQVFYRRVRRSAEEKSRRESHGGLTLGRTEGGGRRPDGGRTYPDRPVVGVGAVILVDGKIVLVKRVHEPCRGQWNPAGRRGGGR